MIDHSLDKTPLTPWWHHVAIMAAYAATFEILSALTSTYWLPTGGLRVTCLLLVPRRFWAALAAGELIPIAVMTVPCTSLFGIEWTMVAIIPVILVCMPVVFLMQQHMPIFRKDGGVNTGNLLVVLFLCAVAGTARGCLAMSALAMQDGSPTRQITWQGVFEWMVGLHLGALAITPFILAIRERLLSQEQPITWSRMMKGSLFRDVLMFQMPIAISMVLAAKLIITDQSLMYFRAALVIPMIVLSIRHGWHGMAVSGSIASVFLSATALDHRDPSLIPTEIALALAISAWLLWTQGRTPWMKAPGMANASAWIALLSLVPILRIRQAFSPRYLGSDGTRYDAYGRTIGKASA